MSVRNSSCKNLVFFYMCDMPTYNQALVLLITKPLLKARLWRALRKMGLAPRDYQTAVIAPICICTFLVFCVSLFIKV